MLKVIKKGLCAARDFIASDRGMNAVMVLIGAAALMGLCDEALAERANLVVCLFLAVRP